MPCAFDLIQAYFKTGKSLIDLSSSCLDDFLKAAMMERVGKYKK
jgi:hypothetical protein